MLTHDAPTQCMRSHGLKKTLTCAVAWPVTLSVVPLSTNERTNDRTNERTNERTEGRFSWDDHGEGTTCKEPGDRFDVTCFARIFRSRHRALLCHSLTPSFFGFG